MKKYRAPPVVAFLIAAFLMWGGVELLPDMTVKLSYYRLLVCLPAIPAFFLAFPAIRAFIRAKTSVDHHKPEKASHLVTGGPYRVTRNPMYLALLLLLFSYALHLANPAALIGPLLFWWYLNAYQIPAEEEVLEKKFGEQFERYKNRVGRWL